MRLLLLPYLYHKDWHQASGILYQQNICRALQSAGASVSVLLPAKDSGWDYPDDLFKGCCVVRTAMIRDQDLEAGLISEGLARELSPVQSSVPFDALVTGVAGFALGARRFLCKAGFTKHPVPVLAYHGNVTCPEERDIRRGYYPPFDLVMQGLEALSAAVEGRTVVHTPNELATLKFSGSKFLSSSMRRELSRRSVLLPRPYSPPNGVKLRTWDSGSLRVWVARSFGPSQEELGHQSIPLLEAVRALRLGGHDVVVEFYTRSKVTDWFSTQMAKYGDAVRWHIDCPREEVLAALYDCELSAHLCDYNGLYASSIEAITSGSPHLCKKSKWAAGELVSPLMVSVGNYHTKSSEGQVREMSAELVTVIQGVMNNYAVVADEAYRIGVEQCALRDPVVVGRAMLNLIQEATGEMPSPSRPDWLATIVSSLEFRSGTLLLDVVSAIEARMDSKTLGRYKVLGWVAKALEDLTGMQVVYKDGAWVLI